MTNLLLETKNILQEHNKTLEDILWCGSVKFGWFSVDEFMSLADVWYDSGYGCQEVATDLVMVGSDFWLERSEYDGSEWWEYRTMPTKPDIRVIITKITGGCWDNLLEISRKTD